MTSLLFVLSYIVERVIQRVLRFHLPLFLHPKPSAMCGWHNWCMHPLCVEHNTRHRLRQNIHVQHIDRMDRPSFPIATVQMFAHKSLQCVLYTIYFVRLLCVRCTFVRISVVLISPSLSLSRSPSLSFCAYASKRKTK